MSILGSEVDSAFHLKRQTMSRNVSALVSIFGSEVGNVLGPRSTSQFIRVLLKSHEFKPRLKDATRQNIETTIVKSIFC